MPVDIPPVLTSGHHCLSTRRTHCRRNVCTCMAAD